MEISMLLLEYYFDEQRKYEEKYGEKTIVLIMKGSFYECYEYEGQGKAEIVSKLSNILLTRANKSKELTKTNPLMVGFGKEYIKRFMKPLLDNNYTVVTIDENEEYNKNKGKDRFVGKIYSPGVNLDSVMCNNSIISIYIDDYELIGICHIDICTGKVDIKEITKGTKERKMEELNTYIEMINPMEVIFYKEKDVEEYKRNFETNERHYHFRRDEEKEYHKTEYQNELLKKIYEGDTVMTMIEKLNIEREVVGRSAMIYLIKYLKEPKAIDDKGKMILHNNALNQLNIVNKTKDKSLINIMDKTSTPMGRRRLMEIMLNPISDICELNKLYDDTEKMKREYKEFEEKLNEVIDVERIHRRIILKKIIPTDMRSVMECYDNIMWINERGGYKNKREFEEYVGYMRGIFDTEKITNDYEKNFFKEGVYEKIDRKYEELDKCCKKIKEITENLSQILKVDNGVKYELNKQPYHIYCTLNRGKMIKKEKGDEYVYVNDRNKCTITNKNIEKNIKKINELKEKIKMEMEEELMRILEYIGEKYKRVYEEVHHYIGDIDYCKSRAKCAVMYNYKRPELIEERKMEIKGMRHPIIERLNQDEMYIMNDVYFDEEKNGILLYGVNGAGKSSYAKSIGLIILMAQSGNYVSADSMEYKPYERLYTRISDMDNIYKGQSSFFVEMNELKSIIHYADENSLILGDEVCRGTEDISAITIVAAAIDHLMNVKSTFIFATHLHKLPEIKCIKETKKLRIKHIEVKCEDDNILFTRKLKEGQSERYYGLDIAKYLIGNKEFIDKCQEIKNEITGSKRKIISTRKSRYNKEVYMTECEICGERENTETHHIKFQKDMNAQDRNKDNKNNLVVLCEECHNKVHNNKIIIEGKTKTIKGVKLKYNIEQ